MNTEDRQEFCYLAATYRAWPVTDQAGARAVFDALLAHVEKMLQQQKAPA